jgi:hypothetical protein
MVRKTGLSDDECEGAGLRLVFESIPSFARRHGIGLTKAWDIIGKEEVKVVHIGRRTLVDVLSGDRYDEKLRAEAASRKPSRWQERCGALACAANTGRSRRRRKAHQGAA